MGAQTENFDFNISVKRPAFEQKRNVAPKFFFWLNDTIRELRGRPLKLYLERVIKR